MKSKWGLSGSALKWIALLSMAIDHIGACILENVLLNTHGTSVFGSRFYRNWYDIYGVDVILRSIGRVAFPIFCFLLVEGFIHTGNVKRYAKNLLLFAVISEIPFDLAVRGELCSFSAQNVFFTLFLGLLVLEVLKRYGIRSIQGILGILAGCALASVCRTDYDAFGVALIVILYLLRSRRALQCVSGALCCLWERAAVFAFLPIYFYNGERGKQPKWFFYCFYPAHLLLYYVFGYYLLPLLLS